MANLAIGRMVLGAFETNCYFIYDKDTKNALVFDPGKGGEQVCAKLRENGIEPCAVMLTHGHFDHIMGVNELLETAGIKLYALDKEDALCRDPKLNESQQIRRPYTVSPDVLLTDGEEFEIAGIKGKIIATPGHTAGSCCYYFEEDKFLITGDTLFAGSIGRTDLATGSETEIIKSVHKLLDMIPDDVKVYPGHGDASSIGEERRYNPFFA